MFERSLLSSSLPKEFSSGVEHKSEGEEITRTAWFLSILVTNMENHSLKIYDPEHMETLEEGVSYSATPVYKSPYRELDVCAVLYRYLKRFTKSQNKDFIFGNGLLRTIWPYDDPLASSRSSGHLDDQFNAAPSARDINDQSDAVRG